MTDHVATVSTSIQASRQAVWDALVSPEAIRAYMFGTEVQSDWQEGSAITWSGEFHGKPYQDKGQILRLEPGRRLEYTHFSPLTGQPDAPENYHTITVELSGDHPTELILSQDNNSSEKALQEARQTWTQMLEGLKKYVEQTS